MSRWRPEDLALLTGAESLVMTAGGEGGGVELGMVLVRGELYVRAYRGAGSRWYQAAREHGHGRIRLGNVTRDVVLETPADEPAAEIDAAYRRKYGQAAGSLVASPAARAATVRIVPAG